jgi:hypothetical protein
LRGSLGLRGRLRFGWEREEGAAVRDKGGAATALPWWRSAGVGRAVRGDSGAPQLRLWIRGCRGWWRASSTLESARTREGAGAPPWSAWVTGEPEGACDTPCI